jgi:polyhydroxybutyrate depolymerase
MKLLPRSFLAFGAACFVGFSLAASQAQTPHKPSLSTPHNPAPQPYSMDVSETLIDQGQQRTYYLHTPKADTPAHPLPLIVALHGSGMQGKEMADKTAFNQLADQVGAVVVYPDGLKQKWNVSGQSSEDNVAFVHALIRQVQQQRSIDSQRIYVVGLSNGGFLAQKLACEAPEGIAAIATVAASLPNQIAEHCQTQNPISLLMVNGTADSIVPWQGGASPEIHIGRGLSIPPIPTVINFWQQHNACSSPPQIQQNSKVVQVTSYTACRNNSEVMLAALQGAEHIWSGGGYGQSSFGDTTARVWQFLQHHSLAASS